MMKTHLKYIDDLSLAAAINLRENLVTNPDPHLPLPLSYHERTRHILPDANNVIQEEFDRLKIFADERQMVLNEDKTKVMLFNTGKSYDFMPQIETEAGDMLEVVEEMKLLGIIVRSDMTWHSNTKQLCQKGYSRLWMLRNLKKLGACRADLVDVYYKQCRSVLELAVPAWTPGLTKTEINQLERVQKSACAIILGENYASYKSALRQLDMETLELRRQNICLTFGKKALKSDKFKQWFSINEDSEPVIKTRNFKPKPTLKKVKCRKKKYRKSPIPYLTDLLNDDFERQKSKQQQ